MALIDIDYGGIATSQLLNDNFHYLDQSINAVGVTVSGHTSSITSLNAQITNVSNTLTENINTLSGKITAISNVISAGTIIWFAGSNIPTGCLLCDGTAKSRTDYADLFEVIGTTYGAGDGSTTFNLPNLIGKIPAGSDTVGTVNSIKTSLANKHKHRTFLAGDWNNDTSEVAAHEHTLPSLALLPCIKY